MTTREQLNHLHYNGLPFETKEMMLQTVKEIGKLDIQALKIHMLYVIKNTKLYQLYLNSDFEMQVILLVLFIVVMMVIMV